MKRLLAFVVIASLGVCTVGCDSGKTTSADSTKSTQTTPGGGSETKSTDSKTTTDSNGGTSTKSTSESSVTPPKDTTK